MIIAGAGGHARELAALLIKEGGDLSDLCFFDNRNPPGRRIFERFPVLHSLDEIKEYFGRGDRRFVLGTGKPSTRKYFYETFLNLGGLAHSVVSNNAHLSNVNVSLGHGLNILPCAVITNDISIGNGVLIHVHVSIHHDVEVGDFCELSPGCRILGNAKIGNHCSIGSGAVILPGVRIGEKAVIGAGAVVTKDIPAAAVAVGVPASLVRE